MDVALQTLPDGSQRIVDSSGRPLPDSDADVPVLHILPRLLVPAELRAAELKCGHINLQVRSTLPGVVSPDGGIRITQPYPNSRYFVGGSDLTRLGWIVPLPLDLVAFDIEFEWRIEGPGLQHVIGTNRCMINHLMHVQLTPGKGSTYTMDPSCWDLRPESASGDLDLVTDLIYDDEEVFLVDHVSIPGIPMGRLWSINAFQNEQLHEVDQVATFTAGNDHHRSNAAIDMPAALFMQAVQLAGETPFEKGSSFQISMEGVPGGLERHPALALLCTWWDSVRPAGEKFRPGLAMPIVRVRDDGEYWWGYYETPNCDVEGFNPSGLDAARIGDFMLVRFYAAQDSSHHSAQGMGVYVPSGEMEYEVGIPLRDYLQCEYDEALYSLIALREFPSRFPSAWGALAHSFSSTSSRQPDL